MERKLGRGLSALIPDTGIVKEKVDTISIDKIIPNKNQPRKKFNQEKLKELVNSIKEKGVIQPVIVRPAGDRYELIAGERRLRAAKELGVAEIPAIVKDVDEADSLELSLIENIQREELNALEEAEAYKALVEKFNFSQDDISKAVGKDKSTVSNTLRLLALPKLIQDYIHNELLTMGHAKAVLALSSERRMIQFSKRIIRNNLSVRQAEELVKNRGLVKPKRAPFRDENLAAIEEELQHKFGTRVKIVHGKKRGRIEIQYFSLEDLDRVLNLLR